MTWSYGCSTTVKLWYRFQAAQGMLLPNYARDEKSHGGAEDTELLIYRNS